MVQMNFMKREKILIIRRDNFLVRDTARFHEHFELFMPHERAFKTFVQYLKSKKQLLIFGTLWKCAGFYLEIESTYPVLKGTILTETEEELTQVRDYLQQLILIVT